MTESSSLLLVNDHDLATDLSEFSVSIVRELYLASRKLEGPDIGFAAAGRILDRPLAHLRKWFRLVRVADLEVSGEQLRFGGLDLTPSAFTTNLGKLLRERGVEHLVIVPPVAPPELHAFLRGLTQAPEPGGLARRLQVRGVRCLHVNDPEWRSRLEQRPGPVPVEGKATLEHYVSEHWSNAADLVCAAAAGGLPGSERLAKQWHCYATPQVIEAALAPRFSTLPAQAILEHARVQLEGGPKALSAARPSTAYWQGLLAAVARHPYGYELTRSLRELLAQEGVPLDIDLLLDAHVRARFDAKEALDQLTSRIFSTACTVDDLKGWGATFVRLLKAGPLQAATILEALLLHLKRDDREARRKAHFLLGRALAAAAATEDAALVRWLGERMIADLASGEETFEFSDLLSGAGELLATAGQWEALAALATRLRAIEQSGLHPGRERTSQVVLERWQRPQAIDTLFRVACDEPGGPAAVAVLSALGGRDVALRAASLITHSQRRVRLSMLELLSGMGEVAVTVCEELLAPAELWQDRSPQGVLADASWYTIRNTFHIMGRVGGEGVLPVLKRYLEDPDTRVRLEIVRALERTGTAAARALLLKLAEEGPPDVRKAAVTALGTVGTDHEVMVIQELLRSDAELAECALLAIGHIGGRAAKDFLFRLLDGDARGLPAEWSSRLDTLVESALRALVQNPDSEIVARIENFCRTHNRTFRIPLVTDASDSARPPLDKSRSLRPS